MEKLQTIDFALQETIIAHPDYLDSIPSLLQYCAISETPINYEYFTSQNQARERMKDITQPDILSFILTEIVKIYNAMSNYYFNDEVMLKLQPERKKAHFLSLFPDYGICSKAVYNIANDNLNSIIYYKTHPMELLELAETIVRARYNNNTGFRNYIENTGNGLTYLRKKGYIDLPQKIKAEQEKVTGVADELKINVSAINKCVFDVMTGCQLKHQHNEYALKGELFAYQEQGNKPNQEDSVIIANHLENDDFKFIAVSDGVGGVNHGDKASIYLIQELTKWFYSLNPIYYFEPLTIQNMLNQKISSISESIYNKYNKDYKDLIAGATIVASIVTKDYRIISSVGDSRIYLSKDDDIRLVTQDESYVWPQNKSTYSITQEELDDLRFHTMNRYILRAIGDKIEDTSIQTSLINNQSYDRIILVTDGVTDLLSQEQIRIISSSTPPNLIARRLVEEAITKKAIRNKKPDNLHDNEVPAAKDNTTAAIYARR